MKRVLVTDSTAYLDGQIAQEKGIFIVPLNFHLKNRSYKEGLDISNHDYYELLKSEAIFPTTSQPSSGDFLQIFNQFQTGDEVLVISLSSKLSGTMQSAQIAAKLINKDIKIFIHDSKSAAAGLEFQVLKAWELLEAGEDIPNIIKYLEMMRENTKIFFMVNNLEYLARGGRIGKAASVLGNILQLKPILGVEDGEIGLFDKVRSRQKAVKALISQVEKEIENLEAVTVISIDANEEARKLQAEIQAISPVLVGYSEAGPVIGSHVGPGGLGVALVTKS